MLMERLHRVQRAMSRDGDIGCRDAVEEAYGEDPREELSLQREADEEEEA